MRHDDSIKGYKRQRKWNFPPNIIMFNWIGRSPTCFHGKWHTAMALHTALALVFRGHARELLSSSFDPSKIGISANITVFGLKVRPKLPAVGCWMFLW